MEYKMRNRGGELLEDLKKKHGYQVFSQEEQERFDECFLKRIEDINRECRRKRILSEKQASETYVC